MFRLKCVELCQRGEPATLFLNGDTIDVEVHYSVLRQTTGFLLFLDLLDEDHNLLVRTFHDDGADAIPTVLPGEYVSKAVFPANLLAGRTYELRIQSTIFNVWSCMGEGIGVRLPVENSTTVNRGYAGDTFRAKPQPRMAWSTAVDVGPT